MKNTNVISHAERSGYLRICGWIPFLLTSFLISSCTSGRSIRYAPPEAGRPWKVEIVAVHSWEGDCNAGYDLFIDNCGITELAWNAESLRETGTQTSTGEFGGVPVTLTVVRRVENAGGLQNRCRDVLDITVDQKEIARFAF
ncbi:MAG TPA: hypothetical protein VLY03_10220 [Bacteroidota bacterium]|nr:hypothetical protein [Bacteroidota bacterium]